MRRGLISLGLLLTCLLAACSAHSPAGRLQVITHPDGPLYVGDQVSFEVLTPAGSKDPGGSVNVYFKGENLGSADFASFGIGNRNQATLWWVWDTHSLKPGRYKLSFTQLPKNTTWTETFSLHPQDQAPSPEPEAHWTSVTTTCCNIYYITGSAAERDIASLSQEADQQSADVSSKLGLKLDKRMNLILMSRVVGQGGFTRGDIYISYLDDNYMSNAAPILFHHEFVHYYDEVLGGKYRPTFFEEGLAVYLTGGHYKPEPLAARAAALLNLGWYIPLKTLANDFYNQQHEISYLEAATLVKYMVDTYGWEAFIQFYLTIPAPDGGSDSAVIDTVLHKHFNISMAELETAYLASLRAQPFTDSQRSNLQSTVDYFNTVRRYQKTLDPSAYFLTAWLPEATTMRQRGIVADLLRHPIAWDNRLVEKLLDLAQAELLSGDYTRADATLKGINLILQILERVVYPPVDFIH
jgi:hypothetical protein